MIEVHVERVVIYNNELIVLLRPDGAERVLPIHIDPGQAHAIELQLQGLSFPRPLTHDLFKNVLKELGCRLVKAEVHDLVDGTFYARLVLEREGVESVIDARPSDAIALALRCESPVFVADEVMDKAGVLLQAEGDARPQRKATRAEMLEKKLQDAIKEERYEDAAGLRDEIKQVRENKTSN